MTIAAEVETRIGRPVEGVFAELIAVERYPEWLIASGIRRVEIVGEGPLVAGTHLRISQSVGGRASELEGSVTAFEAPLRFAIEARDPDGVRIEIDAALDADGPVTRLRWSVRIGLPLRFRMFESMVAPQVRRAATLDVEAFRIRLEKVADA
jgi:uncharacterized protein YndB with AHSA1/START domain